MKQNRRRFQFALLVVAIAASFVSASLLVAKPGDKGKRQKKSSESAGLKILHLTGTPKERGMTHGRRFAREIIRLIDAFIKAEKLSGGPERYEQTLGRVGRTMTIPPLYLEEMEGIFEGVNSKTGGKMMVPSIKRNLKLEDIVAMNAIADSVGFGCSSFGAWGPLTKNGDTIVARNLDWYYLPYLAKHQIVIVQTPDEENHRAGWAGISWPGQIGCYTGMNADGVTVCMHDVYTGPPEQQTGFTPRSLILREAIEKARAATADRDILDVLKNHTVAVGNNIPVGVPFTDSAKSPPFMVFEYDGRKSQGGGVALRRAENMKKTGNSLMNGAGAAASSKFFDLCTNHYCQRTPPQKCGRFEKLAKALTEHSEHDKPLDAVEAGKILGKAAVTPTQEVEGILTYHSVVFEPNRHTMRVAFCRNGKPATNFKWKSVNVRKLLDKGN